MYKALTIAGSDSGGGAGIQADLKSMHANGVFGMSVITAITAQNTTGVTDVHNVPLSTIEAQIDAIFADMGADAVKTGMLSTAEIIRLVARKLKEHKVVRLVVDPVMVSTSGSKLLDDDAVAVLKSELIPLAGVITPNLPEAEVLVGRKLTTEQDVRQACRDIHAMGAQSVVIKGGHTTYAESTDIFFDGTTFTSFPTARINTRNTHGTGCTFASAVAAWLAKGSDVLTSVRHAKEYITAAIKAAQDWEIGQGHGPVNHFYMLKAEL